MLEVKNLKKNYRTMDAVNNVSFKLEDGVSYALVGESGCGKSTLSKLIMGLIAPTDGEIIHNIKTSKELYTKIQLILQDGKSSLDPHFTVYESIAEPIRNLLPVSRSREREMVLDLMKRMELDLSLLRRKPGELSGGQQKRVCIARALSVSPDILIFDEAVSGLDVIVRRNILQLLKKIQKEQRCTYLFITHDIDVALYIADHIFVMKNGAIVDESDFKEDLSGFTHPYARLLHESITP